MAWNESLSVGVDQIDEQHKELFKRVDQLFEAGKNQKAKEYIGELLDFLDDYTKKHFQEEEQYMQRIQYPEYNIQKRMHTEFIEKLSALKKDYAESGADILVILNANQMMLDWLTKHISIHDKKIGEFARSK